MIPVCRLSSLIACNVFGTNNCSTTQCNCKTGYKGELCGSCDWHNFYFGYHGTDGETNPITGEGVKCQQGE